MIDSEFTVATMRHEAFTRHNALAGSRRLDSEIVPIVHFLLVERAEVVHLGLLPLKTCLKWSSQVVALNNRSPNSKTKPRGDESHIDDSLRGEEMRCPETPRQRAARSISDSLLDCGR